jgi:hypothetical protein
MNKFKWGIVAGFVVAGVLVVAGWHWLFAEEEPLPSSNLQERQTELQSK